MLVKLGHFRKDRGEKKKCLKAPPRNVHFGSVNDNTWKQKKCPSFLCHLNHGVPEKCFHACQIFTWKAFNFFFLFSPDPSGFISFAGRVGLLGRIDGISGSV